MPSFTSVLAASAIAGLALANPLPDTFTAKQGWTVHQSPSGPRLPGAVAYQKALSKFSAPVPQNVLDAAAVAAAGSTGVTTTPEAYDSEYLTPVSFPGGQTLMLDFDTGSADLWVFSSELSASQRSGHAYYNPALSSTSKKLTGYTWSITYGDGSGASGDVYTDNVTIGSITVTGQAVELASKISTQFQQDTDNDGLLGLAFSTINTVKPNKQLTWFDHAIQEGLLTSPLFSVDLKKGAPGSYTFGAIASGATSAYTYTPVNTANGFWEFTGSGYAVGTGSFVTASIDGIADTGTTLLLLPSSIVSAYYSKVKGAAYSNSQGGYIFPCSATLPNFVAGIGAGRFTVPGSYINYAPVSSTQCYGGIQSNTGIGFSIYGDIFLKAVLTVFDKGNTRLGFASKTLS